MVAICLLLAWWCHERAEVASFTESLAKLRSEFRTIEVEFTLARRDAVFGTTTEFDCRFAMARGKDGRQSGMLRFRPKGDPGNAETWVLRGTDLYEFNDPYRTLTVHTGTDGNVLGYAAGAWPGLWLLDRDEFKKRCEVRVFKRDAHYCYFEVKAKEKTGTWSHRLAVAKCDGSVRQVFCALPNGDTEHVKVSKWAVGAGIKTDDFPDPDRLHDGWKVVEWPGRDKLWERVAGKTQEHLARPTK
ncbi:hypothetical protein [Gemmata sp.]|uniref:hypothetical protein n=1 Tax=Gemmata sp. TaxID=1914242 RepID=UPI003F6F24E4